MHTLLHLLNHWVENLTMRQWLVVFGVAVALGTFCLRGMGPKNN